MIRFANSLMAFLLLGAGFTLAQDSPPETQKKEHQAKRTQAIDEIWRYQHTGSGQSDRAQTDHRPPEKRRPYATQPDSQRPKNKSPEHTPQNNGQLNRRQPETPSSQNTPPNNTPPDRDSLRNGPPNNTPPNTLPSRNDSLRNHPSKNSRKDVPPGLGMRGGFGAVSIDGVLYNSVVLRPEFAVGKFGIGLDLPIYFNANGEIRTDEWNDLSDITDKIYYLRYGQPEDNFYLRAGALSGVTLGYGLIIRDYTNTIRYPDVRKTGGRFRFQSGPIGLEGFVADFNELNGPGLIGGRITLEGAGIVLGGTMVSDMNPYLGLPDEDNDGYPDRVDDFPHEKRSYMDSDNDKIPDEKDLDRDGDGWPDNPAADPRFEDVQKDLPFALDPDGAQTKPEPFNVHNQNTPSVTEAGVDIGFPLPFLNTKYTRAMLYAQSAMIFYGRNSLFSTQQNGWGIGAPGLSFDTQFPFNVDMNITFEYRMFSEHFIGEFFDRTYDIERVGYLQSPGQGNTHDTLRVVTKAERILPQMTKPLNGYFGSLSFTFFDWLTLRSVYQDYGNRVHNRSFYTDLHLNTSLIPKISTAYVYYRKSNVRGKKFFSIKDESTLWGYRIGYQLGGSVQLLLGFRESYLDKNGNGKINGRNEIIRTTSVETEFTF